MIRVISGVADPWSEGELRAAFKDWLGTHDCFRARDPNSFQRLCLKIEALTELLVWRWRFAIQFVKPCHKICAMWTPLFVTKRRSSYLREEFPAGSEISKVNRSVCEGHRRTSAG
jgi:hypothetical protein